MGLLVFYLLLAIVCSFLCSILEAVLLSMTPSYVTSMKESGHRSAHLLDSLKRNVDRPLAAILSLNTIAHTAGAAGVGAQAQKVWGEASLTIVSAILTLLILVLSEIIPKTLGATFWRQLSIPTAYTTQALTIALWPLVWLAMGITRTLSPKEHTSSINRDEILAMTQLGQSEGILDSNESEAMRSVIGFRSVKVQEVLTPRVVTLVWPAEWTVRQVMEAHKIIPYSRIPVRGDNVDHILGYVMKNDILAAAAKDQFEKRLSEMVYKAPVVPESSPLKQLFLQFLRKREHMAIVVDEFGGFAGVVTLEDVIETMIGHEIMDEIDKVEDLRKLAREQLGK
ncbi:hemolysin family protein [Ruficoccus sp. ZRK36]|uniref:CNNM domain-containing protein n=1 Tax=Ruficoccus sp. ZRK36 TaxID=2866311 RepID=UPI001C730881|nr:hemolysin family protein [Ruficoccus sp. ZRK36]QYY35033.1 hemolysin family protein [Ruficoccus sp. ZRK36]